MMFGCFRHSENSTATTPRFWLRRLPRYRKGPCQQNTGGSSYKSPPPKKEATTSQTANNSSCAHGRAVPTAESEWPPEPSQGTLRTLHVASYLCKQTTSCFLVFSPVETVLHGHMALISGHMHAPNPMSSVAFYFIFSSWGWKKSQCPTGDGLSLLFWRPHGRAGIGSGKERRSSGCWVSGQ